MCGGKGYFFGLFHGDNQVGFQAYNNYVPIRKGSVPIFHSNRTVIHPDYQGFGLGLKMSTAGAKVLNEEHGYRVLAKFSSIPMFKASLKHAGWRLLKVERHIGKHATPGRTMFRKTGFRTNIKTFTFEYISSNENTGKRRNLSK